MVRPKTVDIGLLQILWRNSHAAVKTISNLVSGKHTAHVETWTVFKPSLAVALADVAYFSTSGWNSLIIVRAMLGHYALQSKAQSKNKYWSVWNRPL